MNTIIEDQLSDELQTTLLAQREAYAKAKRLNSFFEPIIFTTAILSTILLPLNINYKEALAIVSIFSAVAILIISSYLGKQTKRGALLQEHFDVELFKIDWNKTLVGKKPTANEQISEIHKLRDIDKKAIPWYSENILRALPHNVAVMLCFKCNSVFGQHQRIKYINILAATVIIYYSISIALALIFNTGFYNLAIYLAPSIPFLNLMMNKIKSHRDVYNRYKRIDEIVEVHIQANTEPDKVELRRIQDLLYLIRLIPTKIPTWFYNIFNKETNKITDECIEIIVKKYLN